MMSMSPITAAKRMAYNLWPQARRAITSLQPVVPVEGLGTLAVDKHWRLYYDPEYVSSDNFREPGIVILHELLHLLWGHCGRGENMLGQNPSPQALYVWNMICDLKVNRALRTEELPVPDDWISRKDINKMCAELTGNDTGFGMIDLPMEKQWSVERIFNLIMQRIKHEQARNGNQGGGGVHGEAEPSGGLSGGEQHHEGEAGHEDSGRGDSTGGTSEETDRTVSRGRQPDQRSEGGDEGDCPAGGHSHSSPVGGDGGRADPGRGLAGSCADGQTRDWELPAPENGGPGLQTFDLQPIVRDVANSVLIREGGLSWGHESGSVAEWAEGYINPQIDPYTALMRYVLRTVADSSGGNRQTYTRPNRRRRTSDLLLPGKRAHKPRITICVDTSGSMEDSDIGLAVGLINRVLNRFQVRSGIRVITGDTSGKTSTVVNRKLDKLLTMGGGGTDMRPLIDEALSTSPKPQLVLVVTDGGTPWPESSKGVPVVACITRCAPDNEVPDWMGTFCMVK